jgi:hypothetical protein
MVVPSFRYPELFEDPLAFRNRSYHDHLTFSPSPQGRPWHTGLIRNVFERIPDITEIPPFRYSQIVVVHPFVEGVYKACNHAHLLFPREMSTLHRRLIYGVLERIPEDRRSKFIEDISPVIDQMDGLNRFRLITVLEQASSDPFFRRELIGAIRGIISLDERSEVIRHAFSLIKGDNGRDALGMFRLIQAILRISVSERSTVIENARLLINPEMSAEDRSSLIDSIDELSLTLEEKDRVVKDVGLLTTPGMDIRSICNLISEVSLLPLTPEERTSVIQHVQRLMSPQMGSQEILKLIAAITAISPAERVDVVENVHRVTQGAITVGEMEFMIGLIGRIPAKDRTEVARYASLWINLEIPYLHRLRLISSIERISSDKRGDVVGHGPPLITLETPLESVISMILEAPPERRDLLVLYASQFIIPGTYPEPASSLISMILEAPPDQRGPLVLYASPLIKTSERPLTHVNRLTLELRRLPPGQRLSFVLYAIRSITPLMSIDDLERAIRGFYADSNPA